MKLKPQHFAEIVLLLFGIYLVIDSFALHWLSFAYPQGTEWLNDFIDHWMLGIVFILIGYIGLRRK